LTHPPDVGRRHGRPEQCIEERRLAGLGPPDQRDAQRRTQPPRAAAAGPSQLRITGSLGSRGERDDRRGELSEPVAGHYAAAPFCDRFAIA
jgi:hypothetical protein